MQALRGDRPRVSAGAGLTLTSVTKSDLPRDYRGSVLRGVEAARRASSVSGPFRASPPAYLIPGDEDSLGSLIRWAWEREVSLIPRGAGTGMPGGNLGPEIVVEIGAAFGGVEVLDAQSGRIRTGAGEVAGEVDRVARRHGGFLPFLPSAGRWCRVGGMVANNSAGVRSFRHGAISAWVDALEGFYAWGEHFRVGLGEPSPGFFTELHSSLEKKLPLSSDGTPAGWPPVRKNSSGYALDRFLPSRDPAQLLVGSEGTLAFITRADLRFCPLPDERGLAVLRVESPEALTELALVSEDLGATACEFFGRRFLELVSPSLDPEIGQMSKGSFALVLIEVTGSSDEVQSKLSSLRRLGAGGPRSTFATRDPKTTDRLWAIRHAASPMIARESGRGRVSTQFIEDSVVPPSSLGDYLKGLEQILEGVGMDAVVFGHAGDGNVHVNPLVEVDKPDWTDRVQQTLDQVTDLVADLGGTLSGEHGDGRLRTPLLSRIWPPHLVGGFRQVKKALDPRGILNPGVIVPQVGQGPLDGFFPRPARHPA